MPRTPRHVRWLHDNGFAPARGVPSTWERKAADWYICVTVTENWCEVVSTANRKTLLTVAPAKTHLAVTAMAPWATADDLVRVWQACHVAQVRHAIVSRPDAPEGVLSEAVRSKSPRLQLTAVKHPRTPPSRLVHAHRWGWWQARLEAARSRRTPPTTLARLTLDENGEVSEAALANPRTPDDAKALAALAR